MTITIPDRLDVEIDVLLDDLPDVAGTLHDLRSRNPRCGRGASASRRCCC